MGRDTGAVEDGATEEDGPPKKMEPPKMGFRKMEQPRMYLYEGQQSSQPIREPIAIKATAIMSNDLLFSHILSPFVLLLGYA